MLGGNIYFSGYIMLHNFCMLSLLALGDNVSNTVDLEASTVFLRDSWVASLQWLKDLMRRVETSGGPYNFKHVTHVDRSYHWYDSRRVLFVCRCFVYLSTRGSGSADECDNQFA